MALRRHRKRQKPDLDERVAIDVGDPEEALRRLVRQPPLDEQRKADQGEHETTPER